MLVAEHLLFCIKRSIIIDEHTQRKLREYEIRKPHAPNYTLFAVGVGMREQMSRYI